MAIRRGAYPSLKVELDDKEISECINNFKLVSEAVRYNAAIAVRQVLIDLMSQVQPRVPLHVIYPGDRGKYGDYGPVGELRRSGRAIIQYGTSKGGRYQHVAKGLEDGTILVEEQLKESYSIANRITGMIEYVRENDKGQDIALWTHEYLKYHHDRDNNKVEPGYYARTPLTGPKYLQTPWLENRDKYIHWLNHTMKTLPRVIGKITKTSKKPGKHVVSNVKLVSSQIAEAIRRGR